MADLVLVLAVLILLAALRRERRKAADLRELRRIVKDAEWSRRGRKRPGRAKGRVR